MRTNFHDVMLALSPNGWCVCRAFIQYFSSFLSSLRASEFISTLSIACTVKICDRVIREVKVLVQVCSMVACSVVVYRNI